MMMKKYASLLFALFLALSLSVSAAADSSGVYVYDDAALLTQEEYDTLTASAMAVADQYGCGVYVVTVDDMADYIDPDAVTETGETGMAAFTEYAWDALGLAASYDSNGIMLALSMAERDFQMLAHGDTANAAFTDYGKYIMQDEFLDNFREDDWYGGFADYIAACGRYLEANANGAPIDVEPSDETEEEYEPLSFGDKLFFAALMAFRFGLPLGLIVAFIVCAIYKRQLKSVRRATEAARYTVSGGAEITAREDRFTHTTEVRTPIKTESDDHDSGPSFSGGTTVNSGGFSHSGGQVRIPERKTSPMKRILCALLSALLLLTLTACGGKQSVEDPSVQPPVEQPDTPDTPDPPAPSEAEQSLADLRETIRAAGAVLGCAYLGSTNGETDTDLTALLEGADCLTAYPFLREIPAEQVVAPGGWDIYCIVPADENADVAVNEYGWLTEGAELPEAGELLYHGSGAAPVYLIANESDIMPNTQVTVTAADGTAVIYQPFLSLRDGSLAVPEDGTVYDFTVYPEGFVRETTA